MENKVYAYHIGIDVSKRTLDVAVYSRDQLVVSFQVSNDKEGFKKLVKELSNNNVDPTKALFCAEKTGDYSNKLAAYLYVKEYAYWEEAPIKIKRSMGLQRGKNDKIDACRIALYAYRFQDLVQLWEPKGPVLTKMEQLSSFRTLLIKIQIMLTVFLSEKKVCAVDYSSISLLSGCCKLINKTLGLVLSRVDQRLESLVKQDQELHEKYQWSMSVPGIGKVGAMALLIKTSAYKHVGNAKQLCCFMGIAPFEYSSGSSVRGKTRVSNHGDKTLKSLIHMGSLSAIRYSEEIGAYYERKVGEGKSKMSVINAVRNKIVSRVYACVRDGRMYEEDYNRKAS